MDQRDRQDQKPKLPFRERYTLDQRLEESTRILAKYPTRIPVIVERSKNCSNDIPQLDKNKYLIPDDLTIGQFMYVIRKRMKINSEKALYIILDNGVIPASSQIVRNIYDQYKGKDQFLCFNYSGESTFGATMH